MQYRITRFIPVLLFVLTTSLVGGCASDTAKSNAQSAGSEGQMFPLDGDYAGSHILVAYAGATRANPSVTRTKEEAEARARELIAQLNEDPSQFEALAAEASDGPSGPSGGSLGSWQKGAMVAEFDTAIDKLEVGEITSEPVETGFGYHVIRRDPLTAPHFGAEVFIVAFAGGPQSPPDVTRSHDEAAELASEIGSKLSSDSFADLADEHNDYADGPIFLGGFKSTDREPIPGMLDAVTKLDINEVTGPVEFESGFAFFRRPLLDQRSGAHILIAYAGAMRASPDVTRTKEEALARANSLVEQLNGNPDTFAELAAEYSDGPAGANGGDLGVWFKGQMVPEFDTAIDSLEVGGITNAPVETPFGYHIIRRKSVPQ